jgi:hypothetical protein
MFNWFWTFCFSCTNMIINIFCIIIMLYERSCYILTKLEINLELMTCFYIFSLVFLFPSSIHQKSLTVDCISLSGTLVLASRYLRSRSKNKLKFYKLQIGPKTYGTGFGSATLHRRRQCSGPVCFWASRTGSVIICTDPDPSIKALPSIKIEINKDFYCFMTYP